MNAASQSLMATETAEAPGVVGAQAWRGALDSIVPVLRRRDIPFAVICGRGSSGHAGVHMRYLIETRVGLAVSATAPSVTTALRRPLSLRDALFVVLSQSGGSPDLVASTRAAREAGARTVAFVNNTDSPVADAAEFVVDIGAGPERSVAATKTVVATLAATTAFVAALAGDTELEAALDALPSRLARALALDWSALHADVAAAPCVFVTGRGFGLGPAREIALKMAETLRLPALAYSAAELMHGPRAAVSAATPVIALRQADETATAVDALTAALREAGVPVHDCGARGSLPWIGDGHPVTDAITMLLPAYRAIEAIARAKGFDPDRPPHLRKVTETL